MHVGRPIRTEVVRVRMAGGLLFDATWHTPRVCVAAAAVLLPALLTPHDCDSSAVVLRPRWRLDEPVPVGIWAGKVGSHPAHHRFSGFGRLPHLQLNLWRVGIKGSGVAYRFPMPSPTRALMALTQLFASF